MSFEFTKTIVNGVKSWVKQFVEENAITKTSQLENDSEFVTSDEVDSKIAAIPTPDVSGQINTHNTATDAHNDIRLLVEGLTTRLNALANSDDTTLDQMSEIVAYIKNNKTLIEQVTTNKVNVSDIINNLTTNVTNKPLSAAQGVELKRLIDAIEIPTALKNPNTLTIDGVSYDGSEAKSIETKPLYVDVAHTGDRWTIGNTLAEIEAAYQAKRSIYLNYSSGTIAGYTLPLGLAQRFSATDWIFEGMATAIMSVRVRLNNGNNTETLTVFAKESDVPTVPTKVSAFDNDAGYLTEHQSLDGYATTTDLETLKSNVAYLCVTIAMDDDGFIRADKPYNDIKQAIDDDKFVYCIYEPNDTVYYLYEKPAEGTNSITFNCFDATLNVDGNSTISKRYVDISSNNIATIYSDNMDISSSEHNFKELTINGISYDGSEAVSVDTSILYVTVSNGVSGWTQDYTLEQLEEAYASGRMVRMIYYSQNLPYTEHQLDLIERSSETHWIFGGPSIVNGKSIKVSLNANGNSETLITVPTVDEINALIDAKLATITAAEEVAF